MVTTQHGGERGYVPARWRNCADRWTSDSAGWGVRVAVITDHGDTVDVQTKDTGATVRAGDKFTVPADAIWVGGDRR
ncbi:hypothetical protein [Kutzneria buriramensis]|uniref:Uncharacterized protein n=1 Tax=Kutzneria buriramensis TaxID=1045776 RepID=A0A3E0GWD2_9PSEU|nr:hypothetical protein [Kutzneria buriramensis]REH31021.1 hypothetical protein BCF44_12244 [Kutzneria buriramensis]